MRSKFDLGEEQQAPSSPSDWSPERRLVEEQLGEFLDLLAHEMMVETLRKVVVDALRAGEMSLANAASECILALEDKEGRSND